MSRIRLEWNVESQKIDKSDSEDPQAKRARRRSVMRLVILVAMVLLVLIAAVLMVRQRLYDVQRQLEQLLRDTVSAETAALRIGDINTFLAIQHGADPSWRQQQQETFRHYGELMARHDVNLTGTIFDLSIDEQRGRVMIEEFIDGVSYVQTWFYERNGSVWMHAAPDFAFWGPAKETTHESVIVRYQAVDEAFAQQIAKSLSTWLSKGCEIVGCANRQEIAVNIVTQSTDSVTWRAGSQNVLQILSPYVGRARADMPFDDSLRLQVATQLANHLVDDATSGMSATNPHDAVYLRQSVVDYLVDRFTELDQGANLVKSLAEAYGERMVAQLVAQLSPTASMSVIERILPDAIENAKLDWRDFVKWRLNTEADLISSRSESEWLNLYDTSDDSVWQAAYQRYNENTHSRAKAVIDQVIWQNPEGTPQLHITATFEDSSGAEDQIVLFNLLNDVWKRAS